MLWNIKLYELWYFDNNKILKEESSRARAWDSTNVPAITTDTENIEKKEFKELLIVHQLSFFPLPLIYKMPASVKYVLSLFIS